MVKQIKVELLVKMAFVLFAFCLFFMLSAKLPINEGPDEVMKYDICKYIVKYGRLPHGGDSEVRNAFWGISYGFTPILSYMISAVFIKIASLLTDSLFGFYVAARFTSVLCCTGMVIFVIKIADKLFDNKWVKWSFITAVTMLPQVVFIGSYINNDSLALLSISIIVYAWVIGQESRWNTKSCILLAIGIGLCALSYYNAYGFILTSMILFIVWHIMNKNKQGRFDIKSFWNKAGLISGIVIILAGWWFIRSAIIYDGDFLGLKTTNMYAQKYAIDRLKPSNLPTPRNLGQSLFYMLFERNWLNITVKSFIGVFGGLNIYMPGIFYKLYYLLAGLGIVGLFFRMIENFWNGRFIKDRQKVIFTILMIINIIIPVSLSMYYSYGSDFQPQGRYIMPALIPIMYFWTIGLQWLVQHICKEKVYKFIYLPVFLGEMASPVYCMIHLINYY